MWVNTQKFMLRVKMARLEGNILKFFDKLAKWLFRSDHATRFGQIVPL